MANTQEIWLKVLQINPRPSYTGSTDYRADLVCCIVYADQDDEFGFDYFREYTFDVKPNQYFHHYNCEVRIWGDLGISYKLGFNGSSYDFYSEKQLEYMLKTHKAVEKQLEKMNDENGYPKSPGQYLHRLAKAVKAKKIIWSTQKEGRTVKNDFRFFKVDNTFIEYCDRVTEELHEEAKLLAGKGTKPVELITNAPIDYDGFNTEEVSKLPDEFQGRQLRQVKIQPEHYQWQVNRYKSGLHFIMKPIEYHMGSHPFCNLFESIESTSQT